MLRHGNHARAGPVTGQGNGVARQRKNNTARYDHRRVAMRSGEPRSRQRVRFIGVDKVCALFSEQVSDDLSGAQSPPAFVNRMHVNAAAMGTGGEQGIANGN